MYHTSIKGDSFLRGRGCSFPRGQFSRGGGQFFSRGGSFPEGRFQGALFLVALFRGAVFLEPFITTIMPPSI